MLKKLSVMMSIAVLLTGCWPIIATDGICDLGTVSGSFHVEKNEYADIVFESYSFIYKGGKFTKKFEGNTTISYQYDIKSSNQGIYALVGFYDPCGDSTEDFSSFLTVAHLDDNRTYTIAGFTKEMDQEHNITGGKDADVYNMGYIIDHRYYSTHGSVNGHVNANITQTGEFTFSAGR